MKLTTILAACLTFAVPAMSQLVSFRNTDLYTTPGDRRVYLDFVGGTLLVGPNFVAQLYYGADPCSLTPHAQTATFRNVPTNDPFAGTWIGGTRTLSGFAPGDTVTLQVRVFEWRFGSFERAAASGGLFGVSLPFQYTIPDPSAAPQTRFMENFRAFALTSDFPVNQEPTFTGGSDISVSEDSGARVFAGWATGMSPGPSAEAGQSLTFSTSNDNAALFSEQPAVSSSGTLTFTPAPNANGSAVVTVMLQDDGGTANGGCDTSDPYSFTITVTPVNDPPVAAIAPPPFFQLFPDSTEPVLLSINGLDAVVLLNGSPSFDIDSTPQFLWFESDPNQPLASHAVATNVFGVGEHAVTLRVSDGEFTDSASLFFEVIKLPQAIGIVASVIEDTDFTQGQQTALITSLDGAADAFQEGDYEKGVHKLDVFLTKVEQIGDLALAAYLSFAAEALTARVEASGVIH